MPADPLLRQAVAARRVDERDAEVEGAVEKAAHLLLRQGRIADVPRAEAEEGDAQAGPAEVSLLHQVRTGRPSPTTRMWSATGWPSSSRSSICTASPFSRLS